MVSFGSCGSAKTLRCRHTFLLPFFRVARGCIVGLLHSEAIMFKLTSFLSLSLSDKLEKRLIDYMRWTHLLINVLNIFCCSENSNLSGDVCQTLSKAKLQYKKLSFLGLFSNGNQVFPAVTSRWGIASEAQGP